MRERIKVVTGWTVITLLWVLMFFGFYMQATAPDAGASTGHTPVTICHRGHTITVDDSSIAEAHVRLHHDTLGACKEEKPCKTGEQPTTPVDPPPTPGSDSPTPVPPAPPTSTPQPQSSTPLPPSATQPPCKVCTSKRTFTIRLARQSGHGVKGAVVMFNGKEVEMHQRKDGRWVAVVSFLGSKYFLGQRDVIGIKVYYKNGSETAGIRWYRPCEKKQANLNEPWRV